MTVTYKQFYSDEGFKSVGFLVDENGNFSIANLNTTNSLKISGVEVLTQNSLGSSVTSSSLTTLGTLSSLNANTANDINLTSSTAINLNSTATQINSTTLTVTTTGAITLTPATTGTIDNIDIGTITPRTGKFTDVTATNIFVGDQNVKALSVAFAVALS